MTSWPWIFALAAMGSDPGAQAPRTEPQRLLLENLRVFDVESGEMTAPQDVLIEGERIAALGIPGSLGEVERRIDCSGKFALPGLCDCHTHLAMLTKQGDQHTRDQLRAFVAGGVTYVRDVGGPLDRLGAMSGAIASGERIGPEIFYTGPMLERSPLFWERHNEDLPGFTLAVDTEEDVDRLLAELAKGGARLVKTFSKQDPQVYRHLVEVAARHSLRIVHDPGGPLFHTMPMDRAIALGVTSIEHGKAPWPVVLKDELRKEHDELMARDAGQMERMPFAMKVFELGVDSVSMEKLEELCDLMLQRDAYLCPTLQVFDAMGDEGPGEDVPEEARPIVKKVMAAMHEMGRFFTRELARRKVKLLVGQDGPSPVGIFAEMEILRACGVSAAEVLRGATLYPARWLGVDERLGSIAPGKEATLLILDADPLEDVANARSAYLVIQRGRRVFHRDG